ncbi:hypothetical protein [Pseudochrobactrum sp. HB0163]|uniref:hypothetical protein n=1 Tax=Pseudochrobactrum sp. HB0163 TaxID=3450708 RepID=UPI003F6E1629
MGFDCEKIIFMVAVIFGLSAGITTGAYAEGQNASSQNKSIVELCISVLGFKCCLNEQLRFECGSV